MMLLAELSLLSWIEVKLLGRDVKLLGKSTCIQISQESDIHDFLAMCNPGQKAIMKVLKNCYSGTLVDTPMRIIDDSQVAVPTVNHSYYALERVKELSDNKKRTYSKCVPISFKKRIGISYYLLSSIITILCRT